MHYRDCTQQEIVDAIAKWQDEQYGNYHAYDWKLVALAGPTDIMASNPDPVTGLGGHRYYAIYGRD